MDLNSTKLYPKVQKNKTNKFHEDLMSFCEKNRTLKAFNCLKACKENAPKMLETKTSSFFRDDTYKGLKFYQ